MKCAVKYQSQRQQVVDSYKEMAGKFCWFMGQTVRKAFNHAGISLKRFDAADDAIYDEFGGLMEKYAGTDDNDKEKIASAAMAIIQELKMYRIDLDKYQITVRDDFSVFNPIPNCKKRLQHERRVEFIEQYCCDTCKAITAVYFKWLHDNEGYGPKRIAPIAKEICDAVSEYLAAYVQCTEAGDRACLKMVEGKID